MIDQNELISLTNTLLNYISAMSERYAMARESGKSGDFYAEVKPFADEVKQINDVWKSKAADWIAINRPKNLYIQQIESTHEHIGTISVQAFFPETSKTRFINLITSSIYVLNQLLEALKEKMSPPSLQ
ncbi:YppE family protein [Bacillus sp. S/N-304-OC-R1]|uniref:YppE family protein n=1 Tax=Bacillus sp. S/N-304-OC-R1 TaxID=2758034 RepID=UPI001C8E4D03|nr:YppE family protein [Bacillus sp. S/N-304-OC-R1]MBY0122629.1 YppE family protein [Bacillus sp. S/N-304-OC-R1]